MTGGELGGAGAAGRATNSTAPVRTVTRDGLARAIGAYLIWGLIPLFFLLLVPAGPVEIVAHRIVWSLVLCGGYLLATSHTGALRTVLRDRRVLLALAAAGIVVTLNWLTYVYGVMIGHVVDAALGYFINPLVTVALAVIFLRERPSPLQWLAMILGLAAVAVIWAGLGRLPWISLVLALSFGIYGLIKNRVGATVAPAIGLTIETATMAPFALGYLLFLCASGQGTFLGHGAGHAALLATAGLVTVVPLLLFSGAAARLPLLALGFLQYLGPVLQFIIGVTVLHEQMAPARWWGFVLVWLAILVVLADGLARMRRQPGQLR